MDSQPFINSSDIVCDLMAMAKPYISSNYFQEFTALPIWQTSPNGGFNFTWFLRGIVPGSLTRFLSNHHRSKPTLAILKLLHSAACSKFYNHVWKPRCTQFHRLLKDKDLTLSYSRGS